MYTPTPSIRPTEGPSAVPAYVPGGAANQGFSDPVFDAALKASAEFDKPLYSYQQYVPSEYTKRYMEGWGHQGYFGMQNSENYNALLQGTFSKAINGTLKGVGVFGTSMIDGTAGLIFGLGNMIAHGDLTKFYDNPISNAMEDFRETTEHWLPNYYSDQERNAEWYSPDNWATANFLFDKLVKNAGFAVAAMVDGMAVGSLLSRVKQATVLGRLGEAVTELEQGLQAVNSGAKAETVFKGFGSGWLKGQLTKPIGNVTDIERFSTNAARVEKFSNNVIGKTAAILATATEANAEALQGYRKLKEDLIEQYKEQFGANPDEEAMKDIEARASQGGDARFALNVMTLGISNMVQFPRLIGGSLKTEKSLVAREIREIGVDKTGAAVTKAGENYVVKSALKSAKRRAAESIARKFGIIELSEGVEEGLQFAYDYGIHEYEMSARNPSAIDAMTSAFSLGIPQTFKTKEGMESILLGVLTGAGMNLAKGRKGGAIDKNTAAFVSEINKNPQAAGLIAAYNGEDETFAGEIAKSVSRGFEASIQKEEGMKEGDMVKVKDADAKALFAYVLPRVKYGRFDLVMDELDQYKNRDFEEVRKELGLPENVTREDINKRIESLKQKATAIKNLYESMTLRFISEEKTVDGKRIRKYSDTDIDELVHTAFRVADYDRRMNALKTDISKGLTEAADQSKPISIDALFDKEARLGDDGKEMDLEQVRNSILKKLDTIPSKDQQDDLGLTYAQKMKDLEDLQNRREQYLYRFETLKRQDKTDTSKFDLEKAGVEDYLQYERASRDQSLVSQLDKSTGRRPVTYQLEKRIEEGMAEGKSPADIITDIKQSDTFVYDETKPEVKKYLEDYISRLETEKSALEEEASQMDVDESEAVYERINQLEKEIEKAQGLLPAVEPIETEPFIGTEDDVKYGIAKNFVDVADVYLDAAEKDSDYGDERTITMLESLIKRLENLVKIFESRKDNVLKSKPFSGFVAYVKAKIEALNALKEKIKESINDREKLQKQAEEDYVTQMRELFKTPAILAKAKEILKENASLLDNNDQVNTDIVFDLIKSKSTEAERREFKQLILETLEERKKAYLALPAASSVALKNVYRKLADNPKKYVAKVLSTFATMAQFRETNNAFGRFQLKHQNTYELMRDLTAETGNDYNIKKEEIVQVLEAYHEMASLQFAADYFDSGDFKLHDVYGALNVLVTEDVAKGLPVPTAQQLFAIREALMYAHVQGKLTDPGAGWVYLEGVIGAGKTSIFGKYYLGALARIQGKTKEQIAVATSDTIHTAENINTSLGIPGKATVDEIITSLTDGSFKAEFLIVDEIARFGKQKLEQLAKAVAEFNAKSETQVKVIGLGDRSQIMSGTGNVIDSTSDLTRVVYPLSVSYRSNVSAISDLQNRFKRNTDEVSGLISEVNTDPQSGAQELYGVAGSKSESAMLKTLQSRPAQTADGKPASRMLVVNRGQEDAWKSKLAAAGITGVEVRSDFDAQGQTRDEVFIWLEKDENERPLSYNTRIYTSARGKNFIYLGGFDIDSRVNPAMMSGVTKNKEDIEQRGNSLKKSIGDALNEYAKYFKETIVKPAPVTPATPAGTAAAEEAQTEDAADTAETFTSNDDETSEGLTDNVEVNTPKTGGRRLKFPTWTAFKKKFWKTSNEDSVLRIVPVLKKGTAPAGQAAKNYIAYAVVREDEGKFIEHAVLSNTGNDNEVDAFGLRQDFDERMAALESGYNPYIDFEEKGGFYELNDRSRLEAMTVKKVKITNGTGLKYKYDYTLLPGLFNKTETVRRWFSSFFDGNSLFSFDEVEKSTLIKTFTSNEAEDANRGLDESYVQAGRTYLVIEKTNQKNGGSSRKQFIELKGRVLTDKDGTENEIHRRQFIEPVREFLALVDKFNASVEDFRKTTFGTKTGDALIREAQTAEESQGEAFNLGNKLYNRLITLVADNNWHTKRQVKVSKEISEKNKKLAAQINEIEAELEKLQAKGLHPSKQAEYDQRIYDLYDQMDSAYGDEEKELFDAFFDFIGVKDKARSKSDVVALAQQIDRQVYSRHELHEYTYEKDGKEATITDQEISKKTAEYREWLKYHKDDLDAAKATRRVVKEKDMDGNVVPKMSSRGSAGPVQSILNQFAKGNKFAGKYWMRHRENHNGKAIITAPRLLNHKKEVVEGSLKLSSNYNAYNELIDYIISQAKISPKYPEGIAKFTLTLPSGRKVGYDGYNVRTGITPAALLPEDTDMILEELVKWDVGNYSYSMLQDLFGAQAFDQDGRHKTGMRLNLRQDFDFNKGLTRGFKASFKGKQYSAEELQQNFLESYFVGVVNPTLEVIEDSGAAVNPEPQNTNVPPVVKAKRKKMDNSNFSPMKKEKSSIAPGAETLKSSDVLAYVRRFIPGITESELALLSPMQMMYTLQKYTTEPLWGAFADGIIYLEETGNTIYKKVARHEVFHRIFQQFTTADERKRVIATARKEYGLSRETDKEVEEYLADLWGERRDQEGFWNNLALRIKRFFRKVGAILGFVSKNRNYLESYFEAIDSGIIGSRTEEKGSGFSPKRKFVKDYNNDFALINRVENIWLKYMAQNSDFDSENTNPNEPWVPLTVREIKTNFIEEVHEFLDQLKSNQEQGTVLSEDELLNLRAYETLLKKNPKGVYVVLNDLLQDLYPQMERFELLNEKEIGDDEEIVATLEDLIHNDRNVEIHAKLTDNVRRFLSSITTQSSGTWKAVRSTSALAKLYRSIESFDTSVISDLRNNILAKFQENYNVTVKNGVVVDGNAENKAVLNAVLDLFRKATRKDAPGLIKNAKLGTGYPLHDAVYFEGENVFVYRGYRFERSGLKELKEVEKQVQEAVEAGESSEEQVSQMESIRIESTEEFLGRIAAELPYLDKELESLSHENRVFLLTQYWTKSEAKHTLQDMLNLINSLYDVQPHVGKIKFETDYRDGQKYTDRSRVTYSYIKIHQDKEKTSYKDNLSTAITSLVGTPAWVKLQDKTRSFTSATQIDRLSLEDKSKVLNEFFLATRMRSSNIVVSDTMVNGAFKALTGLVNEWEKAAEKNTSISEYLGQQNKRLNVLSKVLTADDNDVTPSTYMRGDGKQQFYQRYVDFAQRTIFNVVRAVKGGIYKIAQDQFLSSEFYKFNFFNPNSGNQLNKIHDYGLHDSLKDDNEDVVLFSDEGSVDFFKRNFLSAFGGMLNRRYDDENSKDQPTYAQSYYTISNKTYMKFAEVNILSRGEIRQGLEQALIQEFMRPDPETVVNGKKPYKVKNYVKNWKKTFIAGIDQKQWESVRETYRNGGKNVRALHELIDGAMAHMEKRAMETAVKMQDMFTNPVGDKLVFDDNMAGQYRRLVNAGLLDVKELPESHFEVTESEKEVTVSMKEYAPNTSTFEGKQGKVAVEHIYPMVKLWYMNNYINGLMLNQITVGDQAMFKNEYDEIKRMSIFHGIGQNMVIGDGFAAAQRRALVIEDIKSNFDGKNTDYEFKQIEKELNINWADGQGFMSTRSFEDQKKGFGPGANLQPIQKPVYGGIDDYGVPRTLKYSSVVITDELAKKFPLLRQIRHKMELNGLKGDDYTRAKELLDRRIDELYLPPSAQAELEMIFKKNEHLHVDETVFDSAVKAGTPEGMLKFGTDFNTQTGTYRQFESSEDLPEDAIMVLDNRNWRIQLNPFHEIDSKVPLFTQLLYFIDFDGKNTAEAQQIYKDLGEVFEMGYEEVLGELGITHTTDLSKLSGQQRADLKEKISQMVQKKTYEMPGKEKLWEFLSSGLSINAPFLVNDIVTQLASLFNKSILKVSFPGSKFVLQSAVFTHTEAAQLSNGVPKWDFENNVMEVYLPDIYRKMLPADVNFSTDEVFLGKEVMLGWRVPSTGLNSTARIKVLGFYPSNSNIVIAPPNITFQHGSDYDVDSLFIARNARVTSKQSRGAAILNLNQNDVIGFDGLDEAPGFLAKVEAAIRENPKEKSLVNIKKDFLRNRIINTYLRLLLKAENKEDITRPIDFDAAKSKSEPDSIFNTVAYYLPNTTPKFKAMVDALRAKQPVDLDELAREREKILFSKRDLNDVLDIMMMQLDNKSGTKLTGIIANSIKGISYLIQSTSSGDVSLQEKYRFKVDGDQYDAIKRLDKNGKQISVTLGWMVNAAIDNVKEQILPVMNMGIATGNIWIALTSMGMPLNKAVKLMRQPGMDVLSQQARIRSNNIAQVINSLEKRAEEFGKNYQKIDKSAMIEFNSEDLNQWVGVSWEKFLETASYEDIVTQIKALTVVHKASFVGEGLFTTTQAVSFLQQDKVDFADQENILDAVLSKEGIYDSEYEEHKDQDGLTISVNTYRFKTENGQRALNPNFPFTNVDLFKLPHWRSAWKQVKKLYDVEKSIIFKHGPKIDLLARFISKKFGFKADWIESKNNQLIREELMKYLISGLNFQFYGVEMDFSTVDEKPYTVERSGGSGTEYYGAEAFIQRFIDKVLEAKRTHGDNAFLNRIRVSGSKDGLRRLSVTDIGGLQVKDKKMLEMDFEKIDEELMRDAREAAKREIMQKVEVLRKEEESALAVATEENKPKIRKQYKRKIGKIEAEIGRYLYSPFQKEFVKYLAVAEGFRFGSTVFSELLPARIYRPVFNAFDRYLGGILENDMSVLAEHAGLQIAQRFSDGIKSVRNLKNESEAGHMDIVDGKQVFYHAKMEAGKDDKTDNGSFYENAPRMIKYKHNDTETIMVKTPMISQSTVYYHIVGKVPTKVSYQFDEFLLKRQYSISNHFNTKTAFIRNSDIKNKDGKLVLYFGGKKDAVFSIGDEVMIRKPGDFTRIYSNRFKVVRVIKPATEKDDAVMKDIKELQNQRQKEKDPAKRKSLDEQIKQKFDLYGEAKAQYELLELPNDFVEGRKALDDIDYLRSLYESIEDFDPMWEEDQVLNFHNQVVEGRVKYKPEQYYRKAFEANKSKISAKDPSLTVDEFLNWKEKEKDSYLKCL